MKQNEIVALKKALNSPKNIVIIPHKNPDGDAIGSTLALQQYLSLLNHKVTTISPNDYPDFLKWIPNEDWGLGVTESSARFLSNY